MFLRKTLARISVSLGIIGLFVLSLRGPDHNGAGLSILTEPDGLGVWRELITDFNKKYPQIHVQMIEGPPATDTREDMYSVSFLSGEAAYDIVYADVIWIPKFAAAGWLMDLTDRLSPADATDFLSADLRAGHYRGRLYRIPAFTDAGVLYYRKDLVDPPPETFEQLESMANRFRSRDRVGFLWQGKQYEGLITVFLEILWGFGGDWIDGETREVLLDSPEALRAVEFLKQSIGTISPSSVTTYMEEDTRTLFQNGRSVFLRNWPYVWEVLEPTPLRQEGRAGVAPVVHGARPCERCDAWRLGFRHLKIYKEPRGGMAVCGIRHSATAAFQSSSAGRKNSGKKKSGAARVSGGSGFGAAATADSRIRSGLRHSAALAECSAHRSNRGR